VGATYCHLPLACLPHESVGTCLANLLPACTNPYPLLQHSWLLSQQISLLYCKWAQTVVSGHMQKMSWQESNCQKSVFKQSNQPSSCLRIGERHIASACMITKFSQDSRCANLFLWTFFSTFPSYFLLAWCSLLWCLYFDALTPPICSPYLCFQYITSSKNNSCLLLLYIAILYVAVKDSFLINFAHKKWSATSHALVSTKSTWKLGCHGLRTV
jgi:hypothetical protein